MCFRCGKCGEIVKEGNSAMIYYFKNEKEKEDFQKQMQPIVKFSRSGKFILKKENSQKGKGNVSLCLSCYGGFIK